MLTVSCKIANNKESHERTEDINITSRDDNDVSAQLSVNYTTWNLKTVNLFFY